MPLLGIAYKLSLSISKFIKSYALKSLKRRIDKMMRKRLEINSLRELEYLVVISGDGLAMTVNTNLASPAKNGDDFSGGVLGLLIELTNRPILISVLEKDIGSYLFRPRAFFADRKQMAAQEMRRAIKSGWCKFAAIPIEEDIDSLFE